LKIRTLKLFIAAPGKWLSPREAASGLDFVPPRAMWTYLRRLWGFGLLEKRSNSRGTLEYKISAEGEARLHWLCGRVR